MVDKIKSQTQNFANSQTEILPVNKIEYDEPVYMPALTLVNTKYDEEKNTVTVEPRGAYQVKVPEKILREDGLHLQFTITKKETEDITPAINQTLLQPELPDAGTAEYSGIVISNNLSDTNLNLPPEPPAPLDPVNTDSILYAVMDDGTEKEIPYTPEEDGKPAQMDVKLSDYPGIKAIAVRNKNTGASFEISDITALDPIKDLGYGPKHPVSTADDAIIKYEGITISRPSNKIDDVVPEITLNVHDKTEKTATIAVKPDVDASKAAIIEFVGKYNQAVAELNILSQNKPEIIEELDYLTSDEKEAEQKKLGLFQSDFSLTNIKSNMSSTIAARYMFSDSAQVTMLSQLGIATNAGGYSGGYSQSKLRGYLEIDEKKLDDALANHLDDIKMLFGYDSDGDLIVDTGIAYKLDKQISAYTQTGGILAMKTSSLDSKIKSSETKITKLENQMAKKEAELRNKYSQMEGSLNSLEAQQNTISNFTKQQQKQN